MKVKEAEIVILLGSQKGKTETFANLLKDTLLRAKQKVVLHNLNNYASFPKMKRLIVLTSTYGKGVPPTNAKNFLNLLQEVENPSGIQFSVVGFGSRKYPKFCQFAKEVNTALLKHPNFNQSIDPVYIDKSCYSTFLSWSTNWSEETGIQIDLQKTPKQKRYSFKVKKYYQPVNNSSKTIFIELTTKKHKKIKQGDLIVIGSNKSKEQHYPIKKLSNKNVLISFNQDEEHLVSKYFGKLKKKRKFKARHICNTHFQLLSEGMSYSNKRFPNPETIIYPKLLKKLG